MRKQQGDSKIKSAMTGKGRLIQEKSQTANNVPKGSLWPAPINELYVFRSLRLVPDSWPPIPVFLLLLRVTFLKYLFTYV
jgi:hypothetical protein